MNKHILLVLGLVLSFVGGVDQIFPMESREMVECLLQKKDLLEVVCQDLTSLTELLQSGDNLFGEKEAGIKEIVKFTKKIVVGIELNSVYQAQKEFILKKQKGRGVVQAKVKKTLSLFLLVIEMKLSGIICRIDSQEDLRNLKTFLTIKGAIELLIQKVETASGYLSQQRLSLDEKKSFYGLELKTCIDNCLKTVNALREVISKKIECEISTQLSKIELGFYGPGLDLFLKEKDDWFSLDPVRIGRKPKGKMRDNRRERVTMPKVRIAQGGASFFQDMVLASAYYEMMTYCRNKISFLSGELDEDSFAGEEYFRCYVGDFFELCSSCDNRYAKKEFLQLQGFQEGSYPLESVWGRFEEISKERDVENLKKIAQQIREGQIDGWILSCLNRDISAWDWEETFDLFKREVEQVSKKVSIDPEEIFEYISRELLDDLAKKGDVMSAFVKNISNLREGYIAANFVLRMNSNLRDEN